MKVGLVGFPGSGKTTVFGALTGQQAELGYSGKGPGKTNLAVVKVPTDRNQAIGEPLKPRPPHTQVVFVDVAAPPGVAGRSFDASAMSAMRDMDALIQVVRGFPSPDGAAADPVGELTDLATEMTVGDLAILDKRLDRLQKEAARPGETELLARLKAHLDRGEMLRDVLLTDAQMQLLAGQHLLTQKRLIIAYNIAEKAEGQPLPAELRKYLASHSLPLIPLCGLGGTDGATLSTSEQKALFSALGLG